MSQQHTILASDLRVVSRLLHQRGEAPDALFAEAGIDVRTLSQARARVPAAALSGLLEALSHRFPDENIGFELARCHRNTDAHVVTITAMASKTGLEALHRLKKYQALISSAEPIQLLERGPDILIKKSIQLTESAEAVVQTFLFSLFVGEFREISGFKGDIAGVSFSSRPIGPQAQYRKVFGPRVSFGAKEASLALPRDILEQPISTDNVDILVANEPTLESLVRSIRQDNLSARLSLAILDRLPSGQILTQDEAASSQNMSLRTLQRRLEEEGLSFRVLVDQTRAHRAESLLADDRYTLSEIAYQCGFSEQASFSRAFKRWFGVTPSQYRHKLLSD